MDVRCPQCQTLYELDERQTSRGSVTLKCSRCQHVFRFETKSAISQENQRRWMINSTRDGSLLYFTDFGDLHRWIMEKKVRRNDTISRTGEKWVEVGTIPEFAPIFVVVDSISDLTGAPEDSYIATRVREGTPAESENTAVETPQGKTGPGPETAERERIKTNVQFPGAKAPKAEAKASNTGPNPAAPPQRAPQPTPGELPPRPGGRPHIETGERKVPSGAQKSAPKPAPKPAEPEWAMTTEETSRSEAFEPESSGSSIGIILFVLVLLIGGGAAAVWFTQPQLVEQLLGTATPAGEEIVALGETTAATTSNGETTATEPISAPEVVASAYDAAHAAKQTREGEIFGGVMFAIQQPMNNAIDLALTRAGKAAEGGLVDEQIAEAQKALERGRTSKAKDLFEAVLEFEPKNADATSGLGFIFLEQSNPERAARQFRKAIDYGGGDGTAYIGLGAAERQLGNPEAAYNAYDLYLGRYPRGEKASIARYQLQQLKKQLGM